MISYREGVCRSAVDPANAYKGATSNLITWHWFYVAIKKERNTEIWEVNKVYNRSFLSLFGESGRVHHTATVCCGLHASRLVDSTGDTHKHVHLSLKIPPEPQIEKRFFEQSEKQNEQLQQKSALKFDGQWGWVSRNWGGRPECSKVPPLKQTSGLGGLFENPTPAKLKICFRVALASLGHFLNIGEATDHSVLNTKNPSGGPLGEEIGLESEVCS